MTEQGPETDVQGDEGRPPLPRHLAALIGALQGPADLAANHDAYLTYAVGPDRTEGAASA
jgi:hypothetical protein